MTLRKKPSVEKMSCDIIDMRALFNFMFLLLVPLLKLSLRIVESQFSLKLFHHIRV